MIIAPVGKSGPGTISVNASMLIADCRYRPGSIDHFAQIVRRDVGRHADGDAAGAVDQQIGKRAGRTTGSFSEPS